MRFSKSTKAPPWPAFLLFFFVVVVVAVVGVVIIIATIAVVVAYDNFFIREGRGRVKDQNYFNSD